MDGDVKKEATEHTQGDSAHEATESRDYEQMEHNIYSTKDSSVNVPNLEQPVGASENAKGGLKVTIDVGGPDSGAVIADNKDRAVGVVKSL